MSSSIEHTLAETVLSRIADDTDPRFTAIMTSLVRHLHAFVREAEITEEEWFEAIKFLTATGQKCDDKRQEFILLSDVLGVSMLVDAINHRRPEGATENTVLGPFFVHGAPEIENGGDMAPGWNGEPTFVSGRVTALDGKPVAGAVLDMWQSNAEGFYDVQLDSFDEHKLRAKLKTDAQGRYWFRTIKPTAYPVPTDGPVGMILKRMGRHPMRPAHLHVAVTAPGFDTLVTHMFVDGDPYIESDAVFGVKPSLIVEFKHNVSEAAAQKAGLKAPFCEAQFDFVLKPAEGQKLQKMIAPSDAAA
jgi:protocatechuate 3,4-dioxygenase beta subunit